MKAFKPFIFSFLIFFLTNAFSQPVNNLLRNTNDPVAGNANAPITIVEFFDYDCFYCRRMLPILENIIASNPDVRVVFKELPLRGENSFYAAKVALATDRQEQYLKFHRLLMNTNQPMSPEIIREAARKTGISIQKLDRDLKDSAIVQQIRSNQALAQSLKLGGTPAFFVGPTDAKNIQDIQFYYGAMTQRELQSAVNQARAKK